MGLRARLTRLERSPLATAAAADLDSQVDLFARIDALSLYYLGQGSAPPPIPAPDGFDEANWAQRQAGADARFEKCRGEIEAALAREQLERETVAA